MISLENLSTDTTAPSPIDIPDCVLGNRHARIIIIHLIDMIIQFIPTQTELTWTPTYYVAILRL